MGKLHSQLALFGSVDDEVVKRNDPRKTAIVERFLPGTTGYGQRGWFKELRKFIDQLAPSGAVEFPNREDALRDLIRPQAFVREMSRDDFEHFVDQNDPRPAAHARPNSDTLTVSTLARATYAAAVIAKVDGPRRESPSRPVFVQHDVLGIVRIRDEHAPAVDDPLTALLEMAVPHRYSRGLNIDTLPSVPPMRDVISGSQDLARGRPDWAPFMARMHRERGVDPWVAAYPPPCIGAVRKIDGEFCTVVTTEVFANVKLEQIEAIVDPRNWHQDLPSFFCTMEPRPDDSSGWSQILECVSTECSEYRMKTALKYWNADRNDDGIYINYDLAGDRTGDSGLVEVDSGYIWIARAQPTGVRIKTSKALKICGLSPTATAALACYSGWAQVGIDMLVNAALDPHDGAVDWDPSALPQTAAVLSQQSAAPAATPQPDVGETRLPDLPPGFRQDMLHDASEQANQYIDAMSRLTKNFVRRWQNGLTRTDVQRFTESVGKEMTDLAVGSFDSVMGNFRPKVDPSPAAEGAIAPTAGEPDLVDRLADTARQVVGDSKTVADEAADKIDTGNYTAADMTITANRLAGIAYQRWAELAGIALSPMAPPPRTTVSPPPTSVAVQAVPVKGNGLGAVLQAMSDLANRTFLMSLDTVKDLVDQRVPETASVVTDHMAEVIRRMADQANTVADDAAKKLDGEGYSADDLAKTITKFGDVALINGIELAGTALVGPGRYEVGPITSDLFELQNADPNHRHKLTLTAPLALAGSSNGETISEDRVTFDSADGILAPGRNSFRIRVKPTGLRSGVYVGAVWAVPLEPSGSQAPGDEISEEIVPVIIGL